MSPARAASPAPPLPRHCRLQALDTYADQRGDLTEVFREEWFASPAPRFWRALRAHPETPTAVRVCARDWIYVSLLDGALLVGLSDLRPLAAGAARSARVTVSEAPRQVLAIAPGVAYGLFVLRPALYLMGRVERADPADNLLCAWDSPGLDIDWTQAPPGRSASPGGGVDYAEFKRQYAALARQLGSD